MLISLKLKQTQMTSKLGIHNNIFKELKHLPLDYINDVDALIEFALPAVLVGNGASGYFCDDIDQYLDLVDKS